MGYTGYHKSPTRSTNHGSFCPVRSFDKVRTNGRDSYLARIDPARETSVRTADFERGVPDIAIGDQMWVVTSSCCGFVVDLWLIDPVTGKAEGVGQPVNSSTGGGPPRSAISAI